MAKDENKKVKKEKKKFLKNFKAELKKVIWPTPKQLVNNTIAVITIVLITAAIVFVLDLGFDFINQYGVQKLRDAVSSNEDTNIVNSIEENTNTEESTNVVEDTNVVENTNNTENTTSEDQNQEEVQADNTVAEDANSVNQVNE